MSLTDGERRRLSDIERRLTQENPRLARRLRAFEVVCRAAVPEQAGRPSRSPGGAATRWFVAVAFAISALLALTGVLSRPPASSAACVNLRAPALAMRSSNCRGSTCVVADCVR